MTDSPIITRFLTVPTLAANGRPQLTVGVELSSGQRFWADCVDAPAASRTGETAVFDPIQTASHVQTLVGPLWQGEHANQFRPLAQKLLNLTEPFRYTRLPSPKIQPAGAISRRSLITGFMAEEAPAAPQPEEIIVERPLHPALQYGLTAALLQAAAAVNRVSVAELVVREYGQAGMATAVPLQITLDDETIQTAHAILTTHVGSLGYTTSPHNHKTSLGAQGERLQRHLRQVAAWLPTLNPEFQPTVCLDVQGGLGELFAFDSGKILGALVGLEHAAKPFALLVQNPVWRERRAEQVEQLKQLIAYLTMRKMASQLVADAWVDSLEDARAFADPNVCQMVRIDLPRLGNLEMGITAVLHLQALKQPVILSGESHPITTHIALATQPALLSGSPQLHYNVMQQLHHTPAAGN